MTEPGTRVEENAGEDVQENTATESQGEDLADDMLEGENPQESDE